VLLVATYFVNSRMIYLFDIIYCNFYFMTFPHVCVYRTVHITGVLRHLLHISTIIHCTLLQVFHCLNACRICALYIIGILQQHCHNSTFVDFLAERIVIYCITTESVSVKLRLVFLNSSSLVFVSA